MVVFEKKKKQSKKEAKKKKSNRKKADKIWHKNKLNSNVKYGWQWLLLCQIFDIHTLVITYRVKNLDIYKLSIGFYVSIWISII